MEGQCGRVDMAGGWHFVGSSPKGPNSDERKHTVGPGLFFLVSDNRDVHDDSRDFGWVPVEYCQERVVFRFWGASGFSDAQSRFSVIR
jgi:signal peptidase I